MLPVRTTTTGHSVLNPMTKVFHNANADPTMMTREKTCSKNLIIKFKYSGRFEFFELVDVIFNYFH